MGAALATTAPPAATGTEGGPAQVGDTVECAADDQPPAARRRRSVHRLRNVRFKLRAAPTGCPRPPQPPNPCPLRSELVAALERTCAAKAVPAPIRRAIERRDACAAPLRHASGVDVGLAGPAAGGLVHSRGRAGNRLNAGADRRQGKSVQRWDSRCCEKASRQPLHALLGAQRSLMPDRRLRPSEKPRPLARAWPRPRAIRAVSHTR